MMYVDCEDKTLGVKVHDAMTTLLPFHPMKSVSHEHRFVTGSDLRGTLFLARASSSEEQYCQVRPFSG
jgi:hypothetical protein